MKKPYLNPEISVYKIASENVAFDLSDIFGYSASDFSGSSANVNSIVQGIVEKPFAD